MDSMDIGALAKRAGMRIELCGTTSAVGFSFPRHMLRDAGAIARSLPVCASSGARRPRVRNRLATLIAACSGHGRAADCPIVNALGAEVFQ